MESRLCRLAEAAPNRGIDYLEIIVARSEVRTGPIRLRILLLLRDEVARRADQIDGFVTALRFHLSHSRAGYDSSP
jgi:hypothetical protein